MPLPILADPATFEPQPGDGLVLAIGILGVRRRVAETLAARVGAVAWLTSPAAAFITAQVITVDGGT